MGAGVSVGGTGVAVGSLVAVGFVVAVGGNGEAVGSGVGVSAAAQPVRITSNRHKIIKWIT
jgi:hypothetical protein